MGFKNWYIFLKILDFYQINIQTIVNMSLDYTRTNVTHASIRLHHCSSIDQFPLSLVTSILFFHQARCIVMIFSAHGLNHFFIYLLKTSKTFCEFSANDRQSVSQSIC